MLQALASSETTISLGRLYLNSLIATSVLGIRPTDVQPLRPSVSIDTQRSLMVVAGVQCVPRFTHCASRSNSPPHGRLSPRMGSALGRARHLRTMESRGIGETHQSSRVGRCGQSHRNVSRPTTRVAYLNHQGGTESQTLHRLTGHVFELYASVYSTLVARHIPGKRNVLADSPSRGACGNRRMDPQPFGLPRHLSSLGVTHHRPVCRKTKHSASYLRVSDTRHDQVNRRHVPRLEGYVGVQVPTRCHTSTDLSEDSTRFAI